MVVGMFFEYEAFYGEPDVAHLKRAGKEWLGLASTIRRKLGKKAYLLDTYLANLLSAMNAMPLANCVYGAERASVDLRRLCISILEGKTEKQKEALYSQAKEYIESHPLPYQEEITVHNLYCIALFDECMKLAVAEYAKELTRELQKEVEIVRLRDLYRQICALLGSEAAMEKLELLTKQLFLLVYPMRVYLQAITIEFLFMLTSVDIETGRTNLSLSLENWQEG